MNGLLRQPSLCEGTQTHRTFSKRCLTLTGWQQQLRVLSKFIALVLETHFFRTVDTRLSNFCLRAVEKLLHWIIISNTSMTCNVVNSGRL